MRRLSSVSHQALNLSSMSIAHKLTLSIMSLSVQQLGPAIMLCGVVLGLGYGTFVHQKEPSWKFPIAICSALDEYNVY